MAQWACKPRKLTNYYDLHHKANEDNDLGTLLNITHFGSLDT